MNNADKYMKFFFMIGISTVTMFFLMYLNTYEYAHVRFSETRFFMTLVMGAAMAVIMLAFMLNMYTSTKVNAAIILSALLVFAGALYLVRAQTTVQDSSWMKAMIPHHSIAILTSSRAEIDDVRVQQLAADIVNAQRREIKQMEWLIDDIKKNGKALSEIEGRSRQAPKFEF